MNTQTFSLQNTLDMKIIPPIAMKEQLFVCGRRVPYDHKREFHGITCICVQLFSSKRGNVNCDFKW